MTPGWSNAYLGIPWVWGGTTRAGCDCAGLVSLVYAELTGIRLDWHATWPDLIRGGLDRASIETAIEATTGAWPWRPVVGSGAAAPLDLLVFRRAGIEDHVGVLVDKGLFLHVRQGDRARLARLDQQPWAARLAGVYRHRELDKSEVPA